MGTTILWETTILNLLGTFSLEKPLRPGGPAMSSLQAWSAEVNGIYMNAFEKLQAQLLSEVAAHYGHGPRVRSL